MTIRLQPGPKAGDPGRGEVDDVQPQRIAVLVVDGEAGVETAALEGRGAGERDETAARKGDPRRRGVVRRGRRGHARDKEPENGGAPKNQAGSVKNHQLVPGRVARARLSSRADSARDGRR